MGLPAANSGTSSILRPQGRTNLAQAMGPMISQFMQMRSNIAGKGPAQRGPAQTGVINNAQGLSPEQMRVIQERDARHAFERAKPPPFVPVVQPPQQRYVPPAPPAAAPAAALPPVHGLTAPPPGAMFDPRYANYGMFSGGDGNQYMFGGQSVGMG